MPPHSDLVQESKLETIFFPTYTEHTFYKRGASGREWRIRVQEQWQRERRLGQGAYGTVWLETCDRPAKKNGPAVRAVKEIPLDPSTSEGIDYYQELEAVMKFSQDRVYTPSFVESYGWFQGPEAIYIAMEYIPHGDLQKHLSHPIPEEEVKMITRQLAEGLNHMHKNGFTHRDLKPGNILVVSRGPDWLVQISDFGISRRLRQDQATLGTIRRGTLGFIAPEMLGFIQDRSHPYAVDIWSLGTVIFRMLTKKLFLTDFNLLQKYVTGGSPFPSGDLDLCRPSPPLKAFLRQLLEPSPKERPTATEVLAHDWIRTCANISLDHNGAQEAAGQNSGHFSQSPSIERHSFESDTGAPSAAWSTAILSENITQHSRRATTVALPDSRRAMPRDSGVALEDPRMPIQGKANEVTNRTSRTLKHELEPHPESQSPPLTARFFIDEKGTTYPTLDVSDRASHNIANKDFRPITLQPKKAQREHSKETRPSNASNSTWSRFFGMPSRNKKDSQHNQPTKDDRPKRTATKPVRDIPSSPHEDRKSPKIDLAKSKHDEKLLFAAQYLEMSRGAGFARSSTSPSPSPDPLPRQPSPRAQSRSPQSSRYGTEVPQDNGHAEPKESGFRSSKEEQESDKAHPPPPSDHNEIHRTDRQKWWASRQSTSRQRVTRKVATPSDALKAQIPLGYDITLWDPQKEPLLFLKSVFDMISFSDWLVDCVVYCQRVDDEIVEGDADRIMELVVILEKLDKRAGEAELYAHRLPGRDIRELAYDLNEGSRRLFRRFQNLLRAWENTLMDERSKRGERKADFGFASLLGQSKNSDDLERFMTSVRLFILRYDANLEAFFESYRNAERD
ncbi:calcium/calmodulin-dependent protein kinase type 1B [Colletotrichum truncatum]|uniref:Calcium/calmodulin-dependent protein kinase type 1B n=1 Tax=Colletotrichum truncatum TaxID=5467 RepID=A0ACC3YYW5_COLTU|nr:calcium/calmodulin-dependent protein kinase type 1B [Colletotrichum truncatum]KAF6781752.1 calcium/calmodulin-dependent protein kinase type 1B [Colletotrichum truncatum]